MPQVGQYNQQVIDAWQRLQQPELDRTATATRNRLAAQGLTQGSQISNTSESNINDAYGKARDNAILQGFQQGNTEYGQALAGRTQQYNENLGQSQNMTAQRTAAEKERTDAYQAALSGSTNLGATRDSLNPNSWAPKVSTSAVFQPLNAYGAAGDTLAANISNANIDQAKTNSTLSGASNISGCRWGHRWHHQRAGAARTTGRLISSVGTMGHRGKTPTGQPSGMVVRMTCPRSSPTTTISAGAGATKS